MTEKGRGMVNGVEKRMAMAIWRWFGVFFSRLGRGRKNQNCLKEYNDYYYDGVDGIMPMIQSARWKCTKAEKEAKVGGVPNDPVTGCMLSVQALIALVTV